MNTTLQKSLETRNDVVYEIGELMERWEKRITDSNRELGCRFVAGELQILIAFRSLKMGKVCVIGIEAHSTDNDFIPDAKYGIMFVNVVEDVQQPKQLVPAVVWLTKVNFLYSLPPRTLYFSSTKGFVTVYGMKYRELNGLGKLCTSSASTA